jgi:hypothetical protein
MPASLKWRARKRSDPDGIDMVAMARPNHKWHAPARTGESRRPDPVSLPAPGIDEGVRGVRFVKAVVVSSRDGA